MCGPEQPEITPDLLLRAYAAGIFPMAESDGAREIFWVDPERRGILPLDGMHISRRLARSFRTRPFEIRIDSAFAEVLDACAARPETWINPQIRALYIALFRLGQAHSVEIWEDGALAGGLYGVNLGAAFFGESMFSRSRDTSKFALIALVARLRAGGFRLLDTQFVTDHLASLGAIEIPRADYRRRLASAIVRPAEFRRLPPDATPQELLQLCTQIS
ncbi:MAG: leucyl/phenylalanyl-tRNA--protein transferase [Rhodobacteraceae bacterium]|nr:leucyl/phenylalanyl-tRNA--protein transferase [Paracoccaceae bacterium]